MFLLLTIAFLAGLVRINFQLGENVRLKGLRLPSFSSWFFRGVAAPFFVWMLFNGILPGTRCLVVEAENFRQAGKYFKILPSLVITGLGTAVGWWSVVTLGLLVFQLLPLVQRRQFSICAALCSLAFSPIVIFCSSHYSWKGTLVVLVICFYVLVRLALVLSTDREIEKPSYGTALTRINMGRFDEAELEIVEQLEKSEEDFEGWVMLAKLYATRDRDLDAAEKAIYGAIEAGRPSASEISDALNKLAGWYLRIGNYPVSARRILGDLCNKFPKSEIARQASERAAIIPESQEQWIAYRRSMPPRFSS